MDKNTQYSFPRYLLSKQSVDDRALNKDVLSKLRMNLSKDLLHIIEVGGGIGTMLVRLFRWDVISRVEYTLVDEMEENIRYALTWLPKWAFENGLTVKKSTSSVRFSNESHDIRVNLVQADIFDFIAQGPPPADLLIAHAFLDLLPMPESLPKLFSLTKDLAWLTINFDGVTSLQPTIDTELDARIEKLYHQTMDTRQGGGDSWSGRHLFEYLRQIGVQIEAAGSSDWVVYPVDGKYKFDEAYFLQFILYFFEESLEKHPDLDETAFKDWLKMRKRQVEAGELTYIAHQLDFLTRKC